MKKFSLKRASVPSDQNRNALRGGSYSLVVTAIVLAILIAVNVFASALPKSMTNYDISSSKLYSITSNTKVVVNNLQQDVTIYWVVQSGEENDVIENLLSKYESLSDHIEVAKKNPDVYPTFTQQYTSESVPNNSLIVESGEAAISATMTFTFRLQICTPIPTPPPSTVKAPSPRLSTMW